MLEIGSLFYTKKARTTTNSDGVELGAKGYFTGIMLGHAEKNQVIDLDGLERLAINAGLVPLSVVEYALGSDVFKELTDFLFKKYGERDM